MSNCVTLPPDLLQLVDQIAKEEGGRERFVIDAVREKLRVERVAAFERFAGSISVEDHPEWATSESTARWVRRLRGHCDEPEDEPADAPQ